MPPEHNAKDLTSLGASVSETLFFLNDSLLYVKIKKALRLFSGGCDGGDGSGDSGEEELIDFHLERS